MEAAEFLCDRKEERINGRVYLMSPSGGFRHSIVNGNISRIIGNYLRNSLCYVTSESFDLYIGEDYVTPDIMLICDRKSIKKGKYRGVPRFIAETLSPATARKDKTIKKDLYEKLGVDEYWIIFPNEKVIEIYYLENGKYELHNVVSLLDRDDKDYNGDTAIALRGNPDIKLVLEEIFEGLDYDEDDE